jgi:hypothetical protein
MKTGLQHFFHPLHLWCLCGGQGIRYFRLYERWVWQPFMRCLLKEKSKDPGRGIATMPHISSLLTNPIAPPDAETFH